VETHINQRSIYVKIQTILGCAYSERHRISSLEDLKDAVVRSRSPAFTYFRAHRIKGSEVVACSQELILERIKLCAELDFIDRESGQLTKSGREALKKESFGGVVSRHVQKYLGDKGFDFGLLKSGKRVAGSNFWLPTASLLYNQNGVTIPFQTFRRLLNLLVECGSLQALQSRLFLPPNTYEQ
jgi:hypothetical protein